MSNKRQVSASDVLLVGSVPFKTVENVFEMCGPILGEHVFALPDGEVGDRWSWVGALPGLSYDKNPDLEVLHDVPLSEVKSPDGHDHLLDTFTSYKLKPGVTETIFDLHFGPEAIKSYEIFCRLRKQGRIPEAVRFQVDFPFTLDAVAPFFPEPADFPIVARGYERSIQQTIAKILDHVPVEDLAIQFDYCAELVAMAGAVGELLHQQTAESQQTLLERFTSPEFLCPLSDTIPDEVLLGYHICYGTWGGWPVARVLDMSLCVQVANALVANTRHRVDYVHLPSMPEPPDDFFKPLSALQIGTAKAFLGIELSDGLDALLRRAEQARRYLPDFGLAHYCGYGREKPEDIRQLLEEIREGADRISRIPA